MGEHEVTATSELHAQAEGTKKQKREEQAAPVEAQTKTQRGTVVLKKGDLIY